MTSKALTQELIEALETLPLDKVEAATRLLLRARGTGARIFTAGNGGSGSIASHFAGDLIKNGGQPVSAICLTDNTTALTAYANDDSYSVALRSFFLTLWYGSPRQGTDVLFIISSSGNSANLIDLVGFCDNRNVRIVALIGEKDSVLAHMLNSPADICIELDQPKYAINEPLFSFVCHLIVEGMKP